MNYIEPNSFKFFQNQWQDEEEVVSTLSSMASETVRNIRTVKSFANEELEANKYKAKLEEHQRIRRKDRMVEPALNNFEKVRFITSETASLPSAFEVERRNVDST